MLGAGRFFAATTSGAGAGSPPRGVGEGATITYVAGASDFERLVPTFEASAAATDGLRDNRPAASPHRVAWLAANASGALALVAAGGHWFARRGAAG